MGSNSMALGDIPFVLEGAFIGIFLALCDRARLAVEIVEALVNCRNLLAGVSIIRDSNCKVPAIVMV